MNQRLALAEDLRQQRSPRDIAAMTAEVLRSPLDSMPHNWSPFGFLVIHLDPTPGSNLRIHIWPEGDRTRQNPDWPIHNHRWVLRSMILAGVLSNTLYEVEDDPQGDKRLYTARFPPRTHSFLEAAPQRVFCRAISTTDYHAGQIYGMPPHVYHDTRVNSGFTSTLAFFSGLPPTEPSRVVGEWGMEDRYVFDRVPDRAPFAAALLGQLRQKLEATIGAL